MASKKDALLVIAGGKPPSKNSAGGGNGGGSSSQSIEQFSNYCVKNGAFHQIVQSRVRPEPDIFPLCNFVCWITRSVVVSDGQYEESFLTLQGTRDDGYPLAPKDVALETFYTHKTCFNTLWSTDICVEPGQAKINNLTTAIHKFTTHKKNGTIMKEYQYAHTGWQLHGGKYRFLSASGALGADSLDKLVVVKLEDSANKYNLPFPPSGDERRVALVHALNRSLDLLTISRSRPQLGALALCAVFRAPIIELYKLDFSLIFLGRWGSGKTELAAAMLAYFGNFDARSIPFNWESTDNSLEKSLFATNSVVAVIDDFIPSISPTEANKLHAKAQRILRGVGNQSGRGRMDQRNMQKRTYFPRGLLVSTNEALPRGASLIGRTLVVELNRGDLDSSMLDNLQEAAREGYPRLLMAAYIQWLAPQMPELKKTIPDKFRLLQNLAVQDRGLMAHPRSAGVYANLMIGLEMFLCFCEDEKLLSGIHIAELQSDIEVYIKQIVKAQADYQETQDEPTRFIEILLSVLSSGHGHINDTFKNSAPLKNPYLFGHRNVGNINTPEFNDDNYRDSFSTQNTPVYKAMGDTLGWINEPKNEIYLDMQATFAAIQRFASQQGDPFLTPLADIVRQLGIRKIAIASEQNAKSGTIRYYVKRNAGGTMRRVVVISGTLIRVVAG
ncbi:MAG: hypothetical protein ABL903_19285 [Methylococcales bacterium]